MVSESVGGSLASLGQAVSRPPKDEPPRWVGGLHGPFLL